MPKINLLDHQTIDKIAAGEVVESPASVVKELVENSMDAGAKAITVEIKKGGIEFIRVTDNGIGISKEEMEKAFLRHATSKISCIEDLYLVESMGFRGEALASIASVSRVEMISKCADCLMGCRYEIEGGKSGKLEEVGAPDGTTIIVRNLFYNTPARRKFLGSERTEGSHVLDLMQQLALSRPDISFQLIQNGITKFSTSGQGQLKEAIYRIYGKSYIDEIVPVSYEENGITIEGYLGTPSLVRANRNLENYFINHRYIKSSVIAKSIESGYQEYLMQHKFPFCVLHFFMDTRQLDVNVHPTKKEVRFQDEETLKRIIDNAVKNTLHNREMIASFVLTEEHQDSEHNQPKTAEPFEVKRRLEEESASKNDFEEEISITFSDSNFQGYHIENQNLIDAEDRESSFIEEQDETDFVFEDNRNIASLDNNASDSILKETALDEASLGSNKEHPYSDHELENNNEDSYEDTRMKNKILDLMQKKNQTNIHANIIKEKEHILVEKPKQLSLFPEKERVLSAKARNEYEIIGQVFDTYWLISYKDAIYFLDQHAAHEKVNYERFMKQYREDAIVSQQCNPPIIVSLTSREQIALKEYLDNFEKLGFEIEAFGGNEYAIRSIPLELYCNEPTQMFLSILEELQTISQKPVPDVIASRIATMACKASIKGGMKVSRQEIEVLLDEMLTLDNPYHCPHGRPTMFSMTKYELEKKFKRIVD